MKKVTLAAILLVSLSFAAIKNDELMGISSYHTIPTDTIRVDSKNDTLANNEIQNIEDDNVESVLSGRISWYGKKFHGRLTSSGEKYDMNEFTAAHKTLPFGTKVKFTNPKNGKEVIVRITDRGPFVPKREFDLSKAAFSELSNLNSGVIHVNYEIL